MNQKRRREPKIWPAPDWAALVSSAVLFVGLLAAYFSIKNSQKEWSFAADGWVLLAIVIVALVPVILLMVAFLASQGATIKVNDVELSFAQAVSRAAPMPEATLSHNLQGSGTSTETNRLTKALRDSHASDCTIVDLRDGQTWWESRLFILIAGAARRGHPAVIVFEGDKGDASGIFFGWGHPDRLLQARLDADRELKSLWREADAKASQWARGEPVSDSDAQLRTTKSLALQATEGDGPDPDFAFELFLQEKLEGGTVDGKRLVDRHLLQNLYPGLIEYSLDETADDDQWAHALTQHTHKYFALTSKEGRFHRLVPRAMVLSCLTSRLLQGASGSRA
jgi:hypothetical protein